MRKSELVILFSAILVLISACKKKDTFGNIEIIGHGGNGLEIVNALYHNNSFEAIELALLTDGCNGIELDARLSADGTLWLFHDNELEETTNGTGCVGTSTDDYLSSLNYSSVDNEALIRLDEIPKSYLANRTVYIDARSTISCSNSYADLNIFLNEILAFREACLPSTEIIVEAGSNDQWEQEFTLEGFKTVRYMESMDHYAEIIANIPSVDIMIVSHDMISKENVTQIHNDGREVVIFGMRSVKSTREAYRKQPDRILADNLRVAIIEKN